MFAVELRSILQDNLDEFQPRLLFNPPDIFVEFALVFDEKTLLPHLLTAPATKELFFDDPVAKAFG